MEAFFAINFFFDDFGLGKLLMNSVNDCKPSHVENVFVERLQSKVFDSLKILPVEK